MKIQLAQHYGMCFGVRDAVHSTHELADSRKITVLGELVHNPVVQEQLADKGVSVGTLREIGSAKTEDVVVTAHGASDRDRKSWSDAGYRVHDTTCPLVRKAHFALGLLVSRGFHPVVIGNREHVEVRGLIGDFPNASVVDSAGDVPGIPRTGKIGIVSQTTQPIDRVQHLVRQIEKCHLDSEVEFKDTVCQPTKNRQSALEDLCKQNAIVVVVGGANSNNTAQLARTVERLGSFAHRVAHASEIDPAWFLSGDNVGITAGTSTLEATVQEVLTRLQEIARSKTDGRLGQRRLLSSV